jgi:hypothetical protein
MPNRVIIYTLIIGLICGFAQAARGQQSGPVPPSPATMVRGPEGTAGGPSESDVATANNPIAPMNAIYFQNYYTPTVCGVPGSSNLLDRDCSRANRKLSEPEVRFEETRFR